MRTWAQLALLFAVAAGLLALNVLYSRQLGGDLLAQLEIEELERIPVQGA